MPNFHARTRLNGATLRLMLSDKAAARFARRIEAVLTDVPYEIGLLEILASLPGESGVHIGFITRDVIADSGSGTSVPLACFADVARQSSVLSLVQMCAAGPDRPIVGELMARDVAVTASSGATAPSVALTASGGVIALARKFPLLADARTRKSWEPLINDCAPRDMRGTDRDRHRPWTNRSGNHPAAQDHRGTRHRCAPNQYARSRVRRHDSVYRDRQRAAEGRLADPRLSAHGFDPSPDRCPRLALMPCGSHVVNVGRGSVIIDRELIEALRSGQI